MESLPLFEILKGIFTSWQVIAATIAIIIYLFIVSYTAKSYHRPRAVKKTKVVKKKAPPPAEGGGEPEAAPAAGDSNEELGLEEA